MKKINQLGILNLHVILPIVIALALIGGVGAYVLNKSGASSVTNRSCGKIYRSGAVYFSAVGTTKSFTSARDSDSVRNIAYSLCKKKLLSQSIAISVNKSGNYNPAVKTAYYQWQRDLGYTGKNADGVPGKDSLRKIGLRPIGW